MDYQQVILAINSACITILLLLAVLLLAATRFRGENGIAAAIIVLPNIPVYIHNVTRMLGWHPITMFFFPLSFSVNTMLMPLLWLFARRNFNPDSRFMAVDLLHFLPAAAFAVVTLSMSPEARMENILHEASGGDLWLGNLNAIVLALQVVVYFTVIFCFLHRKKRYILENCSDAEYLQKEWIPTLMLLFAALFVIVIVSYALWPRTDAWLIQILNVIAMSFLVYKSVRHPALLRPQPSVSDSSLVTSTLDTLQMKEVCDTVIGYLQDTKAYHNNDFTMATLSCDIGIHQKVISTAINGYLHKNFFVLINGMRIEEAKRLLLELSTSDYTVESIYTECGFRSRSTFFMTFKKFEGTSPAKWLESRR